MPYNCAFAVCTTFCSAIAPALVPIFGPSFPSHCVDPAAPEHGRMTIDHSLVVAATEQAEHYRQHYNSFASKSNTPGPRASYSPSQSSHLSLDASSTTSSIPALSRRLRLKRAFGHDSPYDTDYEDKSETSSGDGYYCSPGTPFTMSPQAWGPPHLPSKCANANSIAHSANASINIASKLLPGSGPNPWLSAIPRSSGILPLDVKISDTDAWRNKRRVEELGEADTDADADADADVDADGEDSSGVDDKASEKSDSTSAIEVDNGVGGAEKKAAWLLMKLSVKDGEQGGSEALGKVGEDEDAPRIKRRRATSY